MEKKNILLKLLYPQRCRYCRRVIDLRREMCHTCENTLKRIVGEICMFCGMNVSDCKCGHKKHFYKYICAPFYYHGAASRAIWNLKYNNKTELSKTLAEDMVDCFNKHYGEYDFDFCTFVPLAKGDYKKRGYNQAELLAQSFCEIAGLKCEGLLIKRFSTESQHNLSGVERSGNLLGAIDLKDGIDIENARILLIDDIKTTGSTLNECAKVLRIGGAAEVFCLTVAITDKSDEKRL